MTKRPRVSIGLPVFNGENYLEAALDSIVNQTYTDFELIVSDNNSTDKTAEICKSYAEKDNRIQFLSNNENIGACPNFCKVFKQATGEYFMWAAHDDLYAPTFVEKCVEVLDNDPDVVLCFSKTKFIDDAGDFIKDYDYKLRVDSPVRKERFLDIISDSHIIIEAFGLIRSDVLRTTPLMEGYVGADRVLLGELAMHGRFHIIPEFLFSHREHSLRSTIKFKDLRERTAWHDTNRKTKVVFPVWRIFSQCFLAVVRTKAPLSFSERVGLSIEILRAIKWNIQPLFRDLVMAAKQIN